VNRTNLSLLQRKLQNVIHTDAITFDISTLQKHLSPKQDTNEGISHPKEKPNVIKENSPQLMQVVDTQ